MSKKIFDYEATPGETITEACTQLAKMAAKQQRSVTCRFNGIVLTADPAASVDALVKFYEDEFHRQHEEVVNSEEYKASQAARKATLDSELSLAPALELRDAAGWEGAKANITWTHMGSAIFAYAERWGRLMQRRIALGQSIDQSAAETRFVADEEGITGFMYGAAVTILSGAWQHGDALRVWHNLKTQIRDEGERAEPRGWGFESGAYDY